MQRHVIPQLESMGATPAQIRNLFVDIPRRFFGG
jgi:predicted metal-dependent phosphotriesterase family hydrolase